MKILVVLFLMVIQQVSIAKSTVIPQRVKLKAIFGDKVKSHLSISTKHLIRTGTLIPVIPDRYGVKSVEEGWFEMLRYEATNKALEEIAKSPEHLEEAKELLIERYGDKEYAEHKYEELVNLLFLKTQLEEYIADTRQILAAGQSASAIPPFDSSLGEPIVIWGK